MCRRSLASTDPDLDRLRPVYEDIHARLWRALLAWSGSPHVADEAAAEAFAQAARRGAAVRDPAAWIWRSAFRIAAGELARQRTTEPLGDVDPPAPVCLPADTVDLIRALQRLSDQQRRAIVLVDGAGMTAPEAATARVQLSRARRRLRPLLSDQEADDAR